MTFERRIVTRTDEIPADAPATPATPATSMTRTNQVVERTEVRPSGAETLRRTVVLIFGIVQAFIVLRIVLLLLNAREGNDLVAFILNTSQLFVAPFVGIFNADSLRASGSVLDIAAIAAVVGWTVLEAIILWGLNVMRREPV